MIRGRALERSIGRAGTHYRRVGRAEFQKQELGRLWDGTIVRGAPIDFHAIEWGDKPRRLAIECKEADGDTLEFGEKGLRETQVAALDRHITETVPPGMPIHVGYLVCDFTARKEVYRIDWSVATREFLSIAWRKSLTLTFFRAFGELCKESNRGDDKHRRVWVLDTALHPEIERATQEVAAERAAFAASGKPPIVLFDDSRPTRKQAALADRLRGPMPKPGTEEYRQRIAAAMTAGIDRQLRGKKRK